jgi:hypothetical protein
MKLLALHSDVTEYEITGRTSMVRGLSDELKPRKLKEVLAVFTTVGGADEQNSCIVEDATSWIAESADQVTIDKSQIQMITNKVVL